MKLLPRVRLFAAEDGPSLSGSVVQELLESKKLESIPVSVHASPVQNLRPSFECVKVKRARLNSTSILAMVEEVSWHCPKKFSFNSSWQVASGDDSSETQAQRQRDLSVLEVIYPRPSAVPSSSVEPLEVPATNDDSQVIEIPILSMEEHDEGLNNANLSGETGSCHPHDSCPGVKVSFAHSPGLFSSKNVQNFSLNSQTKSESCSATTQSSVGLTSTNVKKDDPDVAAAAAAAFAVVKAKENGALIDQDLLIKILSNPVLIESLTALNPRLQKRLGDISSGDGGIATENNSRKLTSEQSYHAGHFIGPTRYSGPSRVQGMQMCDASGFQNPHPWFSNASNFPTLCGRGYLKAGIAELGQVAQGPHMNVAPPNPILRQDSRDVFQNKKMPCMIMNDGQFGQPTDEALSKLDVEGCSLVHPWGETDVSVALPMILPGRSRATAEDKPSIGSTKKQCLFYNSSMGCRNGVYCAFVHDLALDRHGKERLQRESSLGAGDTASNVDSN